MSKGIRFAAAALVLLGSFPHAQGPAPAPFTLLTAQGRRPFPVSLVGGQEMVTAEDITALLQVAVRDEPSAGGVMLSYRGQSVVVSPDEPMASVGGRLVPLPAPAIRRAARWLIPLEALPRALSSIYDGRIELRRPSRLIIAGDLTVPRVTLRVDGAGPPTRLSVEALPPSRITPVAEAGRLVLRFDADALDLAPLPQAAGLLERADVEDASLVLLLAPRAGQARVAQAGTDTVSRVNVEVPEAQGEPAGDTAAAPAAPASPDAFDTPAPGAQPIRVIVIDPGHGGTDAGAAGSGGGVEKTLALEIARRARTLIESRGGVRVLLTRDADRDVALDERASMANLAGADAFLSLHLNASFSGDAAGAEIYVKRSQPRAVRPIGPDRGSLVLPLAGGGSRLVPLVPWDAAQARHREGTMLLANLTEAALRARVPMSARPVQEVPLRALAGLDMPAVLLELAYLSNRDQEQAAMSAGFQDLAAQALLEAVTAFRTAAAPR